MAPGTPWLPRQHAGQAGADRRTVPSRNMMRCRSCSARYACTSAVAAAAAGGQLRLPIAQRAQRDAPPTGCEYAGATILRASAGGSGRETGKMPRLSLEPMPSPPPSVMAQPEAHPLHRGDCYYLHSPPRSVVVVVVVLVLPKVNSAALTRRNGSLLGGAKWHTISRASSWPSRGPPRRGRRDPLRQPAKVTHDQRSACCASWHALHLVVVVVARAFLGARHGALFALLKDIVGQRRAGREDAISQSCGSFLSPPPVLSTRAHTPLEVLHRHMHVARLKRLPALHKVLELLDWIKDLKALGRAAVCTRA